MQNLIYCVLEYMDQGDLYSLLASDDMEPRKFSWYNRYVAHSIAVIVHDDWSCELSTKIKNQHRIAAPINAGMLRLALHSPLYAAGCAFHLADLATVLCQLLSKP